MKGSPGYTGLGITPAVVVFALTWGLGWLSSPSHWLEWGVFIGSMALLHLILMFFLTVQACRGPSEDRRERILEMLLTTPAGPELYLPGRLLSLKRQCLRPLVLVLAIDLGLLATGLHEIGPPNPEWLLWIGTFLVFSVKLLVDLYVLSWVGMWQGLKQRNTGRAVRRTVFYILVLKWILLFGLLSILGLATQGRAFEAGAAALIVGIGYAVLVVMSTLHFGALAMSELQDNLRQLALDDGTESSGAFFNWPVRRTPERCRIQRRSWA
jgi:ABC-type Na+ efflux pump permease subunit